MVSGFHRFADVLGVVFLAHLISATIWYVSL